MTRTMNPGTIGIMHLHSLFTVRPRDPSYLSKRTQTSGRRGYYMSAGFAVGGNERPTISVEAGFEE